MGDDVRLRGAAVVVVVVLQGRRAALLSSTATTFIVAPPLRLAWFGRDAAEEGQDLQGALGDGGGLGAALLVVADHVVDVVTKEAAVALQWQREAVMED